MDPKDNKALFTDEMGEDELAEKANKALRRSDSWHG